jgi:hypothetical protein
MCPLQLRQAPTRQERLGDTLLDQMRPVHRKARELLSRMESEGDHRGFIVALREVRECLESSGGMLARAGALNPPQGNAGTSIRSAKKDGACPAEPRGGRTS